ncbi:MAG: hypothetical protein ACJ8FY_25070 [Gemmataceae bacterium]
MHGELLQDWERFRTKVKEKWDLITDDDLTAIAGKREQLIDLLLIRYGLGRARAEKELSELEQSLVA